MATIGKKLQPNYARGLAPAAFSFAVAAIGAPALAQQMAAESSRQTGSGIEEIIVTGRQILLDAPTQVGSRLSLTNRETPAAVELLTESRILELGARSTTEALNRTASLTASLTPNNPGRVSARGFSLEAVSVLYDGVRPVASASMNRAQDSWLMDRIEVMNGPASVLYGEGALAGVINYITKKPILGENSAAALVSAGSFDTFRVAGDVNRRLGETAAVRAVGSYSRTDGYVDDAGQEFFAGSLGVRLQPAERLTINLALDYSGDDGDSIYYGTPLVSASVARQPSNMVSTPNGLIVDKSLRKLNFAVENPEFSADSYWLRSQISYQFSDTFVFTNEASYYDSRQRYLNSAAQMSFNQTTRLVTRNRSIIVNDFEFWMERPSLSVDQPLFGNRNRFSLGGEISGLDAGSLRSLGGVHSPVDPYALVRGRAPDDDTALPNQTSEGSKVKNAAVFVEDAINLTPSWLLVGGLRYEHSSVERSTLNIRTSATSGFSSEYDPVSWRIGSVYDLVPETQIYIQYSSAVVPVGAFNLLSLAASQFNMSTGESVDAGIKSTLLDGRLDLTLAAYRIEQGDILTLDPTNPNVTIQGGRRSSRGVEAAASLAVTPQLQVDANYTVLNARFDELIETGGVSRAGKTPSAVPETIANLFASYRFEGTPITLSAAVRHQGRVFADNANTIRISGYTTADAAISYRFDFGELTLRGRNLTDELYADPVVGSASQVTLAPPRSVELTLTSRF